MLYRRLGPAWVPVRRTPSLHEEVNTQSGRIFLFENGENRGYSRDRYMSLDTQNTKNHQSIYLTRVVLGSVLHPCALLHSCAPHQPHQKVAPRFGHHWPAGQRHGRALPPPGKLSRAVPKKDKTLLLGVHLYSTQSAVRRLGALSLPLWPLVDRPVGSVGWCEQPWRVSHPGGDRHGRWPPGRRSTRAPLHTLGCMVGLFESPLGAASAAAWQFNFFLR